MSAASGHVISDQWKFLLAEPSAAWAASLHGMSAISAPPSSFCAAAYSAHSTDRPSVEAARAVCRFTAAVGASSLPISRASIWRKSPSVTQPARGFMASARTRSSPKAGDTVPGFSMRVAAGITMLARSAVWFQKTCVVTVNRFSRIAFSIGPAGYAEKRSSPRMTSARSSASASLRMQSPAPAAASAE